MVGLKHALPIVFYILTIFMMIKCECNGKIRNEQRLVHKSDYFVIHEIEQNEILWLCPYIKNHHSIYNNLPIVFRELLLVPIIYIRCRNVNLSDEHLLYLFTSYTGRYDIDVSDSTISTLEPLNKSSVCALKLNNITMNVSNTSHFWNEIKSLNKLSITSSNLSTFDIIPISSLKILDLSNNALTSLNTTNFRNLKLDILNVTSNRLSNIYCENVLFEIDLSNNDLSTINCKFTTTLIHLYLNNNRLSNISIDAFTDMHHLHLLDLSFNQLDEVAYIFNDLEDLLHLNLSNNNIYRIRIESFVNLKSLNYLDLSYNEIDSLSHGIFNGLHSLEMLDLSYNNVLEVDVGIFYPSRFCRELYLEGNLLQDLNINMLMKFSNLNKISFTFADISCHKLKEYVDILENEHVGVKSGTYIYLDNINGIKCTARNEIDLYKSSFEHSLNSLKKVHVTLTIIAICFLVIMLIFVVILYYRYKM